MSGDLTAGDRACSSEPSSALAASPALLSINSAILLSMVCAAMDAPRGDGFGLTDAVAAVDGLCLLRACPGQLGTAAIGH